MRAILKNYRQSPRKVRLVADLVKGKSVSDALFQLEVITKKAGTPLGKLIASASANAETNFKVDPSTLTIKSITVNAGPILKRARPRSRGMSSPIKKRTSTVVVELAQK